MSEFELHFCPKYKCNKLFLNFIILFILYVGHYHIVLFSIPECPVSHSHIQMYLLDSRSFFLGHLDFCVFSLLFIPSKCPSLFKFDYLILV